jgi:spore germination protein YaaH
VLSRRLLRDRGSRPPDQHRPARLPLAVALVLLPWLVSACITVTQEPDPGATVTPAPLPSVAAASASPSPSPAVPVTPSPVPEPTAPPLPVPNEVIGFLPSWFLDEAAETLDTDLLTMVAFHGVEASADGRLVGSKPSGDVPEGWAALGSDAFTDLKAQLQEAGVRVVLVVQRFGWTEDLLERTRSLLTTKPARRELATRIAKLVSERGLDGVNLDVEPVPDDLADEYVTFVREVRRALDDIDPELHLSVDVVAGLSGYDLAGLTSDGAADLAILMGYNYRTDGATVAGSTAPLRDETTGDLATTVEKALAQAPGDSLVLALPWYAKAWSTASDEAGAETIEGEGIEGPASPSHAEAVAQAMLTGRSYEAGQESAWTAYTRQSCVDCPATWRQVWYDDADSFGAKMDHALEQGLAGVGIWALGHEGDREELWWALRERVEPRADDAPPNGSASLDPESIRGDLEGRDLVQGTAALRLFASDGDDGSGLFLTRVGLDPALDEDGQLVTGRSYPATERIEFPLADEETGGSPESGPRSIHVQWRDVAGNWSMPVVIEVHVLDPVSSATPEDLPAG